MTLTFASWNQMHGWLRRLEGLRGAARSRVTHTVHTAQARGWETLSNGALLNALEAAGFELLLTADR